MKIAYVSIDEVDREQARGLAGALGVTLEALTPNDLRRKEAFDAVVIDLDDLSWNSQQTVLDRCLAHAATRPTAVHSYGLDDHRAEALRRHGVAVARTLDSHLFEDLVGGRRLRPRPASSPGDDPETLTWIMLAD